MVVNKRKKNSRHRGSWTHGWGEKKKHRGAGSRGGRGNAGSGKRADTNKPSFQEDPKYFGKFGFKRPNADAHSISISIATIESNIASLIASGVASKKGSSYVVDLTKTKYTKLLGTGSVSASYDVTVETASAGAISKIAEAKGKVNTTKPVVEADKKSKK